MERLALFRDKMTVPFWGIVLIVVLYLGMRPKVVPANVWINENDTHLKHLNGFLYYNKVAFSGWLFENYPDGTREKATPYYGGKEEGIMHSWYPNKTLREERLFVHGEKKGIHHGWWPDGKLQFEYYFTDDEHNGIAKEWFNDNKLYRLFHYTHGYEEGLQQMWWPDGTVRANYVVKNGEQFGLIGRKLCKNVFKK